MTHETKIDHGEIIIDVSFLPLSLQSRADSSSSHYQLFTKAYEYFKANRTSRMTLYIASQIALAHFDAGNHEMALK